MQLVLRTAGCEAFPLVVINLVCAYNLQRLQLKCNAAAAHHHADASTHILPSGVAELARMAICSWSWCWLHGSFVHC